MERGARRLEFIALFLRLISIGEGTADGSAPCFPCGPEASNGREAPAQGIVTGRHRARPITVRPVSQPTKHPIAAPAATSSPILA
jgi:hypothetical protein